MSRTDEISLFVAVALISLPLFWFVHHFFSWLCLRHVTNYCRKYAIPFSKWRIAPAFDAQGIKTENTLVDVLSQYEAEVRIHRFEVWPFGIRKVSEIKNENCG